MKINEHFNIWGRREDQAIITNLTCDHFKDYNTYLPGSPEYATMQNILHVARQRKVSNEERNKALTRMLTIVGVDPAKIPDRLFDVTFTYSNAKTGEVRSVNKAKLISITQRLIKFFSEFCFSPSYRFVNSLAIADNATEYTKNYFMVQDHSRAQDVAERLKSAEWQSIVRDLKTSGITPKPINTRFELFFGEPGAGKTVTATKLAKKCIVCSSDMLPTDLMQNFCFKDGKADFDPSDLWTAMEKGEKIVLDEVNMLPFESLRFLQGITDSKDTVDYKGHTITIHPDFKIYATMNLNVNGQTIPLPAPLVDRAYDIKEFKLTAEDLINALI